MAVASALANADAEAWSPRLMAAAFASAAALACAYVTCAWSLEEGRRQTHIADR